jgi:hypothetical protein
VTVNERICEYDNLNPCWDGRPNDVPGKHWGGGEACATCIARAGNKRKRTELEVAMIAVLEDIRESLIEEGGNAPRAYGPKCDDYREVAAVLVKADRETEI